MNAAIERMVAVAHEFRARRLKYVVQHPGQINDETQWPPDVSRETEARAALAAFLDFVTDNPTEEMRIAAINTTLPGIGEPPLYEKIWRAMCLALRRGVAGQSTKEDKS